MIRDVEMLRAIAPLLERVVGQLHKPSRSAILPGMAPAGRRRLRRDLTVPKRYAQQ